MGTAVDPLAAKRIGDDLSRWRTPQPVRAELEPLEALAEVEAWVGDQGRCAEGATDDWESLLDDALRSWEALGAAAKAAIPSLPSLLEQLRTARASLRGRRRGVDTTTSGVISGATQGLRTEARVPQLLSGVITDVLKAADHEQQLEPLDADADLRWQLALLHGFAREQEHDWSVVADRLRSAVGLDGAETAMSVSDILNVLNGPPEQGHSIVWAAIDHAWAWGRTGLEPAVQLFESDWLLGNLEQTEAQNLVDRGVPEELASDPDQMLSAFRPRLNEDLPVVLARVDLGRGPVAGARERALDTLELLRAYASFQQGGTNWRISGARLHFVDGELVLGSYGPIGDPDVYDRLERADILADPTPATLKKDAGNLAPHLPLADARTRQALELARWLNVARLTWAPGRLVLAGRILEQCATWANRTPAQLLRDLMLPWAWHRLEARIERVGRAAVLRMPDGDGTTASSNARTSFLQLSGEILEEGDGRRLPVAKPAAVVANLPELVVAHPPGSAIHPAVSALNDLLSTGRDTHAELDRLSAEFVVLRRRAKRARNALVHGGPLQTDVVASVLRSQDELASIALRWILDAQLQRVAIPSHVNAVADSYRNAHDALSGGARPSDVLFWGNPQTLIAPSG